MAKLVSKTYGDALFEVALESGRMDEFRDEAVAVKAALNENPELFKLMSHPKIVKEEKVKIVQDADAIYREEIAKAGLDREINQYFAALTNMRSVGVMGDFRTYDYAVALRAVKTIDFMTAEASEIPYEVLNKVMNRIINEVKGVNRVFYDLTSKPPGTIEFE